MRASAFKRVSSSSPRSLDSFCRTSLRMLAVIAARGDTAGLVSVFTSGIKFDGDDLTCSFGAGLTVAVFCGEEVWSPVIGSCPSCDGDDLTWIAAVFRGEEVRGNCPSFSVF